MPSTPLFVQASQLEKEQEKPMSIQGELARA